MDRVLATQNEEVDVDLLFVSDVQLVKTLQPLVEASEATSQVDDSKRAQTILRVDAGCGTLDDLNWLLAWGRLVIAKVYSESSVLRGAVEDSTGPLLDTRADLLVGGPAGARCAEAHAFASSGSRQRS